MRQRSRKFFPRLFRIIMALQIEPALGICLEKSRKAQRGIGANRTLARNNFMNTPRRDSNGLCQCRLTNTQRLQPVFQQYFARMNQRNLSCHIFSSMIINNFDMIGLPSSQQKQMRHWSLIRILYCPTRFPCSASSRFPGGTRKNWRLLAACNCCNLRNAIRSIAIKRRTWRPRKSASVSLQEKLLIIR